MWITFAMRSWNFLVNDEPSPSASYRLSLGKGLGRVRVVRFGIMLMVTPHLSPLPFKRGEADTLSVTKSS
jgi:hypothetical protein